MEIYQVKSGDTLSKIARDVLGDLDAWPKIAQLNNLVAPYTIYPGMQLMMPDLEVLGPVVVQARRRTLPTTTTPTPAPDREAGFGFQMTPQTWMYLGLGAVVLFLMTDKK